MKIPHIIQQHQRYLTPLLRAVTAAAGLAVGSAQAVNLATSYSENFDSMGTAGTATPAGWTFFSIGSSSGTWTEATGIPASTVSGGTANATLVVATPPTASSGTQGFNGGLAASPADRALVTAPTGTNGSALQLSVTNTSGGALNFSSFCMFESQRRMWGQRRSLPIADSQHTRGMRAPQQHGRGRATSTTLARVHN